MRDWILRNTESGSPLLQVCRIQVKRDRMDIEAHLKTAHKITCRVYEINFESGQVTIVFFLRTDLL